MARQAKTAQIQLRISPQMKADLMRRARAAGMDLSAWMLSQLAPEKSVRFRALASALARTEDPSFVLAELNDFLAGLGARDFVAALQLPPEAHLGELRANQLAAMVETAGARLRVAPPRWVTDVPPLRMPWFATGLSSLRLHLLAASPPAFRRRNLFVDSTLGARA